MEGLWLLSMLITWESFVCDVVRVRGSEEGVVFWKEKPNCYTQKGEGGDAWEGGGKDENERGRLMILPPPPFPPASFG